MTVKRIDHIAIVVESIEEAAKFYEDALGIPLTEVKDIPAEEVKIAFLPIGASELELLEPIRFCNVRDGKVNLHFSLPRYGVSLIEVRRGQ